MLLLSLAALASLSGAAPCEPRERRSDGWHEKLHADLRRGYAADAPPSPNATTVRARFLLRYFHFDVAEEVFAVRVWTFVSWRDPRLRWRPEDYDGIRSTAFLASSIWRPALNLFVQKVRGTFAEEDAHDYYFARCDVTDDGFVTCPLRQSHETGCRTRLGAWPYDVAECAFDFAHAPDSQCGKVAFDLSGGASALGAGRGAAWDVQEFGSSLGAGGAVALRLRLARRARALAVAVVPPAAAAALLTLAAMLLDGGALRLSLLGLSAAEHFLLLSNVGRRLPRRGPDAPTVLLFVRASFAITAAVVVLTVLLTVVRGGGSAPAWVGTVNRRVRESLLGYFVVTTWKNCERRKERANSSSVSEGWPYFASIVNCSFLYTFLLVYIILYGKLIPYPVVTQ